MNSYFEHVTYICYINGTPYQCDSQKNIHNIIYNINIIYYIMSKDSHILTTCHYFM